MYFVAYVLLVVLLLSNLFIAMIVHKVQHSFGKAEMIWRLRWTSYVLRCVTIGRQWRGGEVAAALDIICAQVTQALGGYGGGDDVAPTLGLSQFCLSPPC